MMDHSKILIVDDEENVLKSLLRSLHKETYKIDVTTSPREALRMLREADRPYAVVVSDQRMPQMEGVSLLEKAREISPDTIRIILTAFADTQLAIEAINHGAVYRFLTKPWNDGDLRITFRQAVSHFELICENKRLEALTARQNTELRDLNENLEQKVQDRTQEISRLNAQLEKGFLGSIQVMARIAEVNSPLIGSHSKRVGAVSREVARYMGVSGKALFQIVVAATLHDIGKIGAPADSLRKSRSSLTPREKELLQRHVLQGEAILMRVPNLEEAARIVRHHHENTDGSGYPDRLRKDDIPLGSRIIAAVDAYDNALNNRQRFQSATPEGALKFVQDLAPETFDPNVVSALTACLSERGLLEQDEVEVEVRLEDLRSGMVLTRDIRTARGILLLPKDRVIRRSQLEKLRNFQESDPIVDGIYVYRKPLPTSPEAVP